MTLETDEFIRRFLLHVLPKGFHRIRHYGLFANTARAENLAHARALLHCPPPPPSEDTLDDEIATPRFICRRCATPMIVVGVFEPHTYPRAPP